MTDAEINQKTAHMLGWRFVTSEDGEPRWLSPDGFDVQDYPPDYCTDPAAWGALFVRMADRRCSPRITHDPDQMNGGPGEYVATVEQYDRASRTSPGRALALAALRAHGVEVTK